jgi:medium-chain acyl-[acyl-carrier-protein] hydrolase
MIKLFCFPYAGGTGLMYSKWKKYLDNSIVLYPIELAGRGKRFNEPLMNEFSQVINDTYNLIKTELDGSKIALFGHSMGSLIAFEIGKMLTKDHYENLVHIFFSGGYPPHLINKYRRMLSKLSDPDFLEEVIKIGGISEDFLKNEELIALYLPILRADFMLLEKYNYEVTNKLLNCDITAMAGSKDTIAIEDSKEWSNYTTKKFFMDIFQGNHFFINSEMEKLVQLVNNRLIGYY